MPEIICIIKVAILRLNIFSKIFDERENENWVCIHQPGVLRGSVVKCLTRNQGVQGSSRTGSSEFFVGVSLGKILQSPSLVLVKPRKDMNNVNCRRDMTEILLKVA